MKAKRILGFVLLVFALGSVIFMLGREQPKSCCDEAVPPYMGDTDQLAVQSVSAEEVRPEQLRVYYFHGSKRCHTCHLLENYAKDVIAQSFSNELTDGSVTWEIVNVELPDNRHYIDDYQLITKSIVLSKEEQGEEVSWKNMDKIWDLVRDEAAYKGYIKQGIQQMLQPAAPVQETN